MPSSASHDEMTARALLKWPDVPASFGWLGLDGRGRWLIQGEPISHPGIRAFLARQYDVDGHGRWYVQNGPQRAFVDLEVAPWVLSLDGHGGVLTHTARPIDHVDTLVVAGDQVLLATEVGLGVVLDRDLQAFLRGFRAAGRELSDAEAGQRLLALPPHGAAGQRLTWGRWEMSALALPATALEARFGFVRQPRDRS